MNWVYVARDWLVSRQVWRGVESLSSLSTVWVWALATLRLQPESQRERIVSGVDCWKQEGVLSSIVTIESTSCWEGQANMHPWGWKWVLWNGGSLQTFPYRKGDTLQVPDTWPLAGGGLWWEERLSSPTEWTGWEPEWNDGKGGEIIPTYQTVSTWGNISKSARTHGGSAGGVTWETLGDIRAGETQSLLCNEYGETWWGRVPWVWRTFSVPILRIRPKSTS